MTIASATAKSGPYTCNGVTTAFAVGFYFLADAELEVHKTQDSDDSDTILTITTDYTVTGAGEPAGGLVTTCGAGSPIASGYKLTIVRKMPLTQQTDLSNQGGWFPDVHETEFDRLVMADQMLKEILDRCPKVPITTAVPTDYLTECGNQATAAAASAATAAGSEAAAGASAAAASASLATMQGVRRNTLTGTLTLSESDVEAQMCDPGVADRSVLVPNVPVANKVFAIHNIAAAGGKLINVKKVDLTALATVGPGASVKVLFDASTASWYVRNIVGGDYTNESVVMGNGATASSMSVSVGGGAVANGTSRVSSFGWDAQASATRASAGGASSRASDTGATAFGTDANAEKEGSAAFGYAAYVSGIDGAAFGHSAVADKGVSVGDTASSTDYGVALGPHSYAPNSVAAGDHARAGSLNSIALGRYSNTKAAGEVNINMAPASLGASSYPKASIILQPWYVATASAVPTEALCSGVAASRYVLKDNSTVHMRLHAIAFNIATGDSASYYTLFMIKRGAGAATTAFVGLAPLWITLDCDAGLAAASIACTADAVNGALVITVTGIAATNIQWAIRGDLVETLV